MTGTSDVQAGRGADAEREGGDRHGEAAPPPGERACRKTELGEHIWWLPARLSADQPSDGQGSGVRIPCFDAVAQEERDPTLLPFRRRRSGRRRPGAAGRRGRTTPGRARSGAAARRGPGRGSPRAAPACTDAAAPRTAAPVSPISTIRPRYITATRSQICSHQPQVVRDEEVGELQPLLQIQQQVHDLRLHRDVERRDRLVGDDERRLQRERARQADALALAAAELVRILRR